MTGPLTLIAIISLPWFGLTVNPSPASCPEVILIAPHGPAAVAGLHEHDCVERVNSVQVRDAADLINRLHQAAVGSATTLTLTGGRVLIARPTARTPDLERSYCEFVRSVQTKITIFIAHDKPPAEELDLSLAVPVTLAQVRSRIAAPTSVRLVTNDICVNFPSVVTDDPLDSVLIPDGSVLYFGYENISAFRVPIKKSTP
jgi:hypothetical protein